MTNFLRRNRRAAADLIHATLAAAALSAAFLLRFDFVLTRPYPHMLLEALPLLVAAKLAVFRAFSLRDLAWRYVGFRDLLRLASSNLAAAAFSTLVLRESIGPAFPRSIHIIDLLSCTALMVAAHTAAKMFWELFGFKGARKRIAIYGAGAAGAALLAEIRARPQSPFEARLFFDDDPLKRSLRIHGVRVAGGLEDLPDAVGKNGIETVLIAMPHASGDRLTAILERCRASGTAVQRLPAPSMERSLLGQVREVRIEDLLGRQPVDLDSQSVRERLRGSRVLVTGAGGSIGSELCRRIARHSPSELICLDHSETALYEIDRELRATFPGLTVCPEIGNVRETHRLQAVFAGHTPHAVYHAAAYKHVPLMESQIFEAIENNVFGTRNVATAAARWGVREFVLISSDKAVRPANVMGATKRLAEMVIQSMAAEDAHTRFMAVRFGNVLGSSGSVIPVFRKQIAAGGPVTVTHPEMRRFFMTISEAAELVLEAAAVNASRRAGRSEIYVLEMGEPVRILDLARKMIVLSGLEPGRDIRVEFTGIRPGEKLHEELSAYEEDTLPTPHSQIRIYSGTAIPAEDLMPALDWLRATAGKGDAAGVARLFQELIPGYHPSSFVLAGGAERAEAVTAAQGGF